MTQKEHKMVKYTLPKIAFNGAKTKRNLPEVEFGMRYIDGNDSSYFTCVGYIWNSRKTDVITCGCSIQDEIRNYFPNDELLKEICEIAKRLHLKHYYVLSVEDMKKIEELIAKVEKINNGK